MDKTTIDETNSLSQPTKSNDSCSTYIESQMTTNNHSGGEEMGSSSVIMITSDDKDSSLNSSANLITTTESDESRSNQMLNLNSSGGGGGGILNKSYTGVSIVQMEENHKRANEARRVPEKITTAAAVPASTALNMNDSADSTNKNVARANLLNLPIAKFNMNNMSQASIDTRIKYGEEPDLIPLFEMTSSNGNSVAVSPMVECLDPSKMGGDLLVANNHHGNSGDSLGGHHEPWWTIMVQVVLPFFIAGFGMVAAGVFFDVVQHWEVFVNINAIYTLVPALLGLKGNLEMTLASRLSTQVNLGKVRSRESIVRAILGNFALTQAQAIIVGFLASISAILLKVITERKFELNKAVVLIAGSMSTASLASLLLAGLMMFVIILSKRLNINPDNVATPIAASLGDLVTLTILSYLCTFLYQIREIIWIPIAIILMFGLLVPLFFYFSYKNEFVKDALFYGWVPIIMAMVISSTGGYIMGFAIEAYQSIAVFQPVINGVGGNLVAIFASRLSTALHRTSSQGNKAPWQPTHWYKYPFDTYFGKQNPESKTAIVLTLLSLPGHIIFFIAISKIKAGHNVSTLSVSFILLYLYLAVLQVILLLLIGYWLVHFTWRRDNNPDNVCIPYLTAIGDLIGTAFLALCFHVLYLSGETGLKSG